ncbi:MULTISPECIES: hypothetical protein [unclassified Marinobacter]|uniref:hypothetical protein n=1 Tax=unclassified Marinobacter TaxID=83889 RepID=UPI001267D7FA|nr:MULTISPECIES: hypothetical protein [unclassified Marinobacter]QFS87615.1 hypothetical protein FIV08_12350 [Marinobacter sp. THAF197a]QFT51400.1 hypothetical protein FIU96_12265 [Marinobacter sp. THAF39]
MNQTLNLFADPVMQDPMFIRAMARFEKYCEVFEPTAFGWKTKPGRHPQESRSKYDGQGRLKVKH